jgi:ankyrin repeat protein
VNPAIAFALLLVGAASNLRAQISDPAYELNRALINAAIKGETEAVRRLAEEGARLDALDQGGGTALARAAENNHIDTVLLLLDLGADPRRAGNEISGPPLVAAARRGHGAIVDLLLERTSPGKDELTSALANAKMDASIVTALLHAGAGTRTEPAYRSPLVRAARSSCVECVRQLLPASDPEVRSFAIARLDGQPAANPDVKRLLESAVVKPLQAVSDAAIVAVYRHMIDQWRRYPEKRFMLRIGSETRNALVPRRIGRVFDNDRISHRRRGSVVITIESMRWVTIEDLYVTASARCGALCGTGWSLHLTNGPDGWAVVSSERTWVS